MIDSSLDCTNTSMAKEVQLPNCIPNPGGVTYQAFFANAANMLAGVGRSGIISEIGGGNNEPCVEIICQILDDIK
jgi:hypothetical protein